MRKVNSLAAIAVMILFVCHMIYGVLVLCGIMNGGNRFFSVLTCVLAGLALLHIVISVILTCNTVYAMHRTGVSYWKENRLFWVRRISGLAVMVFIVIHAGLFRGSHAEEVYLLNPFGILQLILQILLVASLLLHLVTNLRPLRIALGLTDRKNLRMDLAMILSVLLLIAAIAFAVYFIRWRML